MTHEEDIKRMTHEQIVERLTVERGYTRKSWGFRSGVRDGLTGDRGGMCDPEWRGYEEGFAAGKEVATNKRGAA